SRDEVIADAIQNARGVLEEVVRCYWPQRSHFTPLRQSRRARTQNGFSSCKYHCTNFSPKNIHVSAPKARYGPNGNFADQTRFPMSKVASPTTEPTTEPAKMLNKTPRHPRKA